MSTMTIGAARGRLELREFFRRKEAVVFTFALPAFILLLLGSVFSGDVPHLGVSMSQLLTGSMVGAGILSTSFITLGVGVATDREDGTLKRLRGTPMPAAAYFLGKLALVAVASLAEVVLLLAVGIGLYDVKLPTDAGHWLTFAWVFALGVVSCSLLGIAASGLAKSSRSAPAVMNLPFIGLQFISGVFISPITVLPAAMVGVASFFPLKWIAQGMRSVFLPDEAAALEMAGTWEHGTTALVLGAWCVVGLGLCLATFRWTHE